MVERRRAALRQGFSRLRDKVMGTGDSARSGMSDATSTVTDKTAETTRAVGRCPAFATLGSVTEGNPLAAGLIAFGARLLTASLVPPTKQEHRLRSSLKPMLDEDGDEAKSMAQEKAAEHTCVPRPRARSLRCGAGGGCGGDGERQGQRRRTASQSGATSAAEGIKDTAKGPPADHPPGLATSSSPATPEGVGRVRLIDPWLRGLCPVLYRRHRDQGA